jgi:hypothetical protein
MIDQLDLLKAPAAREISDEALTRRAAFVRSHVLGIVQKTSTARAHRTKGKQLLEKAEEIGDTAAGDESRAEYLLAANADAAVEAHILALIARTEIR